MFSFPGEKKRKYPVVDLERFRSARPRSILEWIVIPSILRGNLDGDGPH